MSYIWFPTPLLSFPSLSVCGHTFLSPIYNILAIHVYSIHLHKPQLLHLVWNCLNLCPFMQKRMQSFLGNRCTGAAHLPHIPYTVRKNYVKFQFKVTKCYFSSNKVSNSFLYNH